MAWFNQGVHGGLGAHATLNINFYPQTKQFCISRQKHSNTLVSIHQQDIASQVVSLPHQPEAFNANCYPWSMGYVRSPLYTPDQLLNP